MVSCPECYFTFEEPAWRGTGRTKYHYTYLNTGRPSFKCSSLYLVNSFSLRPARKHGRHGIKVPPYKDSVSSVKAKRTNSLSETAAREVEVKLVFIPTLLFF